MLHRQTAVLFGVIALAVTVHSDESLKCYQCNSLTNDGCRIDPKAHNVMPTECTFNNMQKWQHELQQHRVLNTDAMRTLFGVDSMSNYQSVPKDMACAKMNIKVGNQNVTIRSCQTAKTDNIDPCKTIKNKMMNNGIGELEYCGLCEHEACNGSSLPSAPTFAILLAALAPIIATLMSRGA